MTTRSPFDLKTWWTKHAFLFFFFLKRDPSAFSKRANIIGVYIRGGEFVFEKRKEIGTVLVLSVCSMDQVFNTIRTLSDKEGKKGLRILAFA